MHHFFHKSLTTAIVITLVFFATNHIDVYLEEKYDITGYQKNYVKAPVQFLLIFGVSLAVMHAYSHVFNVKQL